MKQVNCQEDERIVCSVPLVSVDLSCRFRVTSVVIKGIQHYQSEIHQNSG